MFPPPRSDTPADAIPLRIGFRFGGISLLTVEIEGRRRAISDDVHSYLAMVSYPGGHV